LLHGHIGRQTVKVSWAGPVIGDEELSDGENTENDSDSEDDIEATSMINDNEDGHEIDDNDDNDDEDDDDIDDGGDGTEPHREDFNVDVEAVENVDTIPIPQQQAQNPPSVWAGFKIVGDNLGKNIKPSF